MELQASINYFQMFTDLMQRRVALIRQRDEAEIELAKLKQIILGIFPLLPEDQQEIVQQAVAELEAENESLQGAVGLVFSMHKSEWLTASSVREYLIQMGFDFRSYKANPLASIATTLKRMVPIALETTTSGSGTLYRRRMSFGDRIVAAAQSGNVIEDSLKDVLKADRIAKAKDALRKK
jgi:hypothetical protein